MQLSHLLHCPLTEAILPSKDVDQILGDLCELIIQGQIDDNQYYGMVAACIVDPDGNEVSSTSINKKGKWIHAERATLFKYVQRHGSRPSPHSSIVITLSPCSDAMATRYQSSCTDLINELGIKHVYCGFQDPTQHEGDQQFTLHVTTNKNIENTCKIFADTFLDKEE